MRPATIEDAVLIADLGARTFADTFAADNRAQYIHQKWSFTWLGIHEFMLGKDIQNDWIMGRSLALVPDRIHLHLGADQDL